jgi:hypothetical protein
MAWSSPTNLVRITLLTCAGLTFGANPIAPIISAEAAAGHPRVDCLTPAGRLLIVPNRAGNNSSETAVVLNNNTLRCPLQKGETTFIIAFPKTSPLDGFRFLNENAAARGEMKIAISNSRLPFDSPKWIEVTGKTAFIHKRLFTLSMVGVEARYLKLSFRVENGPGVSPIVL